MKPAASDVLAILRDLATDDEDVLEELIALFVRTTGERIAAMRVAAGTGDVAAFMLAAHALRGLSVQIQASGMADVCAELERAGKAERFADAERLIGQLDRQFVGVQRALDASVRSERDGRHG